MNEALSKRQAFDYGTVAVHEVPRVKEIAAQVRKLTVDIGRNGWHIGDKFLRAKGMIPHGQFEAWLSAECDGYTLRTARRLMKLREAYDSPESITFSQTAALVLAEDGVPEAAREEARALSAAGTPPSEQKAAEIADKHAPLPNGEKRADKTSAARKKAAASADPKRTDPVRNHLQPVDESPPVVIETTARTVPEEPPKPPDALSLLSVLTPIPGRLRKVGESVDGGAFDGKAAGQHVECVVAMLHGETPAYRLVKAGDPGAQAAEIYDLYPRKVGRDKALVAIRNALKRVGFDELREAVAAFSKSPAGNAGEFTPHPATWFGEGRWNDDRSEWQRGRGGNGKPAYRPGPGERFDPNAELRPI